MNKEQLITYIEKIIEDCNLCGIEAYAVIKTQDNIYEYQFIEINQKICNRIKKQFINDLKNKFCVNQFEIKAVRDISDNKKDTYYMFEDQDIFDGISFIKAASLNGNENIKFKFSKVQKMVGFLYKIGNDDIKITLYQHYYPTSQIKVGNSIVLTSVSENEEIEMVNHDMIRIGKTADIVYIDNILYTSNIKLLERNFGFKEVIKTSAKVAVDYVADQNLLSDVEKFKKYIYNPSKISKLKKLMQADSDILSMQKEELLNAIQNHHRYSKLIKIENNTITIKNNKDIENVILLLSDGVLTSDITNHDYSVDVKEKLIDE